MTDFKIARSEGLADADRGQSAAGAIGRKPWKRPAVILSDVSGGTTIKGFGPETFQPGVESS